MNSGAKVEATWKPRSDICLEEVNKIHLETYAEMTCLGYWKSIRNRFREPKTGHGGGILARYPHGAWAQLIDLHRACRHVRCVLVRARGSRPLLFIVCRMFVFAIMLHARGNLALESPEELLTSSGTLGPGPLRAYSFLALHFCSIFRNVFLYRFFIYF